MKRSPKPLPAEPIRIMFTLEEYEDTSAAAELYRAIRKAQAITARELEQERQPDEPSQRSSA